MAKCIGCGIKLQTSDENLPGFVPSLTYSELLEETYCKRCFQIIHNGKRYQPLINSFDYYKKIKVIKEEKAIVVLMIDVMDIYGGFIPKLAENIGDNPVIIVLNKIDIMPRSIHLKHLEQRIRLIAKEEKLNLVSVIMISAKKKDNVDAVLKKILKIKENDSRRRYGYHKKPRLVNCYIVGCASVGKSTFINAIKQLYLGQNKLLTTSDQFQTTMDFIKVFVDKDNFIIDTPGLINMSSFGAYLDYESIKTLTPKAYLKPKTFQLNPDQTLFLGGLAQIDFTEGEKINASLYVSNDLYIHRTKTINAANIYETQLTKLLTPPQTEAELENLKVKKTLAFTIEDGVYDLLISGLGFVHIVGKGIKFNVTIAEKIAVHLVPSFV